MAFDPGLCRGSVDEARADTVDANLQGHEIERFPSQPFDLAIRLVFWI